MKQLIAAAIALSLAGCASMPQPEVKVFHHRAAKAEAAIPASPNAAVKKRWFNGFKVRLFH